MPVKVKVDRVSLDDPSALKAGDPGGMLEAVASLGGQLRRGFEMGRSVPIPWDWDEETAVVVCGMGGSAIAGDVVRSLFIDRSRLPIVVSKGFDLPAFCGPGTLLFAVSYSGNTEETLSCYEQAMSRGCRSVAISAGGRLLDEARARGGAHVRIPDDVPMPRAALGYLAGAVLGWLDHEGWDLGADLMRAVDHLRTEAAAWTASRPTDDNEAKSLAAWLLGRTPLIWGSHGLMEAAALRFRNQLNENAKVPAFHSVLPELGHNEVEGWSVGVGEGFAVLALRHDGEHPRVADLFDATIEAVRKTGLDVRDVRVEGAGPLDRLFGTILLGDFVSVYLGILRAVDPTEIPAIRGLKERLSR